MTVGQKPFDGLYDVGSVIWHLVSRARGAWRAETVTKVNVGTNTYNNGSVDTKVDSSKQTCNITHWCSAEVLPRVVIPHVPPGTVYIVNTEIGQGLSRRLPGGMHFEVYECSTKAMTAGNLLGYVVVPCFLYQASKWYTRKIYQTWQLGPNVYELLSFLGVKLPEITSLYHQLETYVEENSTEHHILTAD